MGNCLITKLKESVNNTDLRILNELRIRFNKKGDGSGYTSLGPITDTADNVVLKIVSGQGKFTVGGVDYTDEVTVPGNGWLARFTITSDTCDVAIKNYALVGKFLGTNDMPFFTRNDATNSPEGVLDFSEMKERSVSSIVTKETTKFSGSVKDLADTGIKSIIITGNASNNFTWSFDDIIAVPTLTKIEARYSIISGDNNDLYELLKNKSTISLFVSNSTISGNNAFCSYVSGDIIPTCNIEKYAATNTLSLGKVDTISFLTLLKDGINANKITAPSTISFRVAPSTVASDSEVAALVNDLAGLGVTVSI